MFQAVLCITFRSLQIQFRNHTHVGTIVSAAWIGDTGCYLKRRLVNVFMHYKDNIIIIIVIIINTMLITW